MAVYGNRAYEDTLLELKNTAAQAGFLPCAAVSAVAEHSILRQFAAGRPDSEDKVELSQFSIQIQQALEDGTISPDVSGPGNFPYKEFHAAPLYPETDSTCAGCGLCAAQCPAGGIPDGAYSQVLKDRCISCMRCLALCPARAKKISPDRLAPLTQKLGKFCASRKKNELFL